LKKQVYDCSNEEVDFVMYACNAEKKTKKECGYGVPVGSALSR
jgi:hypothetical protein